MTTLDRDNLTIEAAHLMDTYYMSYNQIAKYLSKKHGLDLCKQFVYRLLN